MATNRLLLLRLVVLAVFVLFAGRLAYLQLWQGAELRLQSEKNHLRWVRSPAARGRILDCQGRPLATSRPALSIWLISGEVPRERWGALLDRFIALGLYPDRAAADRALADCRRYPSYLPTRLVSGLSIHDPLIVRCEEEIPFLPGVYVQVEPVRFYPEGTQAAHTLGYLAEINAEELQARREQGYRLGDRIGRTGVERALEDTLRGSDGGEQVEVDALGRKIRTAASITPRAGRDVTLTINLDIQQAAETALRGQRGAAVALDPATGDILAIASTPTFDPNASGGHRAEFNRAVRGQFPPGSVFKIITAAAALESGKITPETYIYCDGDYRGIHCWKHSGHGALNLTGALTHSCNVYFMRLAELVGPERLAEMARRFGLGEGVDIDGVLHGSAGLVPTPAWAQQHHLTWHPGETLQMGIGQSSLLVTPLQSACVAAAIANGGKLVHPRLIVSRPSVVPQSIGLSAATLAEIERGLRAVVTDGTAKQLDPTLQIAGKTGTAQNPGGVDHAWFAGYAPAGHPTIAVAVLVEHGGHGGLVAAPIAESIIRAALHKGETSR